MVVHLKWGLREISLTKVGLGQEPLDKSGPANQKPNKMGCLDFKLGPLCCYTKIKIKIRLVYWKLKIIRGPRF